MLNRLQMIKFRIIDPKELILGVIFTIVTIIILVNVLMSPKLRHKICYNSDMSTN